MAELTEEKRKRLPLSSFAWLRRAKSGRVEGVMPLEDAEHVRNAAARFAQTDFPDKATRRRAADRIVLAAKKFGIELDPKSAVVRADPPADTEALEAHLRIDALMSVVQDLTTTVGELVGRVGGATAEAGEAVVETAGEVGAAAEKTAKGAAKATQDAVHFLHRRVG